MFDDLPPDLERLHTLRVWHAMWLARIDRKITQVTRRQAEEERGRRTKPAVPEWIVELGIGVGRPPAQVHRGDCSMAGKRRRAVGRQEALRLLADGTNACAHCRPDTALGITGLRQRARGEAAPGSCAPASESSTAPQACRAPAWS
jgi:hypothetical protein